MIRKHLRFKRILIGLAFAAIAAPGAQAAVYVDGPTPGIQAGIYRQSVDPTIISQPTWAQLRVAGIVPSRSAAIGNSQQRVLPAVGTTSSGSADSFSWSDAGIGASVAFGAALMLLTAVGLGRRFRSRGLANA